MKIDPTRKWTHPMPIWTGREDSDGFIAQFTVPMWLFFFIGLLALANTIAWAVIGLVEAVQYVL